MMTAMLTVENILADERVYDTWCVNEDAEYHEAGDEGDEKALTTSDVEIPNDLAESEEPTRIAVNEDQAAALNSMRDVPERVRKSA